MTQETTQDTQQDFTATIVVDRTPEEVYAAVSNPRGWWSEAITGGTAAAGDEFRYRYFDEHRCEVRVTAAEPGRHLAWHVVDNYFSFDDPDRSEWKDTDVTFDIVPAGERTELRFTHVGLVPEFDCFELCSKSWSFYVGTSLKELIESGKGRPNPMSTGGATPA